MSPEAQPTTKPLAIVEKLRREAEDWKYVSENTQDSKQPHLDRRYYAGKVEGYKDAIRLVESDPELLALQKSAERAQDLQREVNAGEVALKQAGNLAMNLARKLDGSEDRVKRLEEALRFYADKNRWFEAYATGDIGEEDLQEGDTMMVFKDGEDHPWSPAQSALDAGKEQGK